MIYAVVSTSLTMMASNIDNVQIRGTKLGNWWVSGETVTFKTASTLPSAITQITGIIYDSSDVEIDKKTISGSDFTLNGWKWQPKLPGFYKVEFQWTDKSGTIKPAQEVIDCKIWEWIKGKPHLLLQKDFIRQCHNFAVLPSPTRPPADIPRQLAISLGPAHEKKPFRIKWSNDNIKLAALLGFHSIRIHPIAWTMIQPKQNEYDWTVLDEFISEAKRNGFENFIGNLFGTPKWASTRPEMINYRICVWEYSAYAPAKMSYWSDFVRAIVKRYPFIQTWELWNEPHLPGQSCFWSDSPENFVELLKTGYQTLKEVQPDCTVWLAGIGMRYLPFYKRIMDIGAGKYFDVLALHCSWVSPTPFQRIDKEADSKPKPWVCSEWHAVLSSESQPVTPTSEALSRDMLLDFMNQIRQEAEIVTFFTASNAPHGREHEMMEFFRKNKQFHQTYGFFRATPYSEPRLMSVVWRNFTDCFAGEIKYLDGFYFNGGEQNAALMQSERGDVLFFWSNTDIPVKLCPQLSAAVGQNSTLLDWEGRSLKLADMEIRPDRVYYLKHPDRKVIDSWTDRGQILKQWKKEPELDQSFKGYYRQGRIFDDRMKVIDEATLSWHKLSKYVPVENHPPAKDFAADFAVAIDESGLDVFVKVSDAIHAQNHTDGKIWQGDGIQFAIDVIGKGFAEDRLEISSALTPNGALLWKESMPSMDGDLPDQITPPQHPLRYGKVKIEKTSAMLLYKIHVDRKDLYPLSYLSGKTLRFSLLVNNNNGSKREGYLEWASGIGRDKDPALYGSLFVDVGKQVLFRQSDLRSKWGSATLEQHGDIVKISSSSSAANTVAAVTTGEVTTTPGALYQLSFNARGNITLLGMMHLRSGKNSKRHDFLKGLKLDDDWQLYQTIFITPAGIEKLKLSLFLWQEAGWFEIKDFNMRSGEQ